MSMSVDHYICMTVPEIIQSLSEIDLLFYAVIVLKTDPAAVPHIFSNGNSFFSGGKEHKKLLKQPDAAESPEAGVLYFFGAQLVAVQEQTFFS